MAGDDTGRDMTKVAQPVHGPRPIASLVPVVARKAFSRASSPGVAQLMEAWTAIVGPALAAVTAPRSLIQGNLTIGCSGPVAMELQHLSTELISRINRSVGGQSVRRLRCVQTLAARGAAWPSPRLSAATEPEATSDAVAHLPEGPLRAALAALGRAVLAESTSRLGKQPRTRC
jgi:hypothetical protein